MSLNPLIDPRHLSDEVLTFIEQREAEQIAYGIYDVTMSGADVITGFQPSEDVHFDSLDSNDKENAILAALQQLAVDLQIIKFSGESDPNTWIFRSRTAETVRLLSKLRQRIVYSNNDKQRHRISNSKRLVADVKFSVASRRVPRRNIPARDCLKILSDSNTQRQETSNVLLEVIESTLTKLRLMSGFQRRALEKILEAIELESQQAIERGVVVTASTGAGKTYAFFLPILAKMLLEKCLRGKVGVKAICIYPRVALSENQLTDFIEILYYLNQVLAARNLPALTIGIESGAAVYQLRDFQGTDENKRKQLASMRGWTFDENVGGYLSPFAYCVGTENSDCNKEKKRLAILPSQTQALVCPHCQKQYTFIQVARDVMKVDPPDIIIATTESLHRRLLSSKYQYLFGTEQFCAPSVVMLDEIHLQTSTAGTQVALLLRRLLARIRLGKHERNENGNLAFVGLSATIAEPIQFLSDLSGIPVTRITHVTPQDEEMQVIGAERFIFLRAEDNEDTAVISTLIQTAMCVLHTMPQPASDSGLQRYRAFGFVQSLDIVGRWLYQMEDAEKMRADQRQRRDEYNAQGTAVRDRDIKFVPLYVYRFPPYNRELFQNFFGTGRTHSCGCENNNAPDLTCPYFQVGECWWVLSQREKAQREPLARRKPKPLARPEPLNIKRKSGSDRSIAIAPDDDLVITTSALEVGYDDEALMCVLQYTAPMNIASFVQRKGRGGRKVGTRPIIVTVLSPYKSSDLFLFRNEHLLTDPTFQKLPLNAQNRYLQRIHGFYALFDWLAYRAGMDSITLELEELSKDAYEYLMQETGELGRLLQFKDYLQRTFAISDDVLVQVLGDEQEGLLHKIFYRGLMNAVHTRFERNNEQSVKTRSFLQESLPENLFSDINLPEVRVDYRPDYQNSNKKTDSESISLAISETIPGNVTFRGGQGATWIPPEIVNGEPALIELRRYYVYRRLDERPNTARLPIRALKRVGIQPSAASQLVLYRPMEIKPEQFSRDHNSSFWYCNPDTGVLQRHEFSTEAGQNEQQLAHSSSANPIGAVDIQTVRRTPSPDYTFSTNSDCITCDPIGQALAESIVLYSDEPENLNLLNVQRIILGSQYTIKFHNSSTEEIRGVVGFKAEEDGLGNCAIGYQMFTEGMGFNIHPRALAGLKLSQATSANLKFNAICHKFVTDLTVDYSENYFAAENLAKVLITIADHWCNEESGSPTGMRDWFAAGHPEFARRFTEAIGEIHQLSRKNTEAVNRLAQSGNDYLSIFIGIYTNVHANDWIYDRYLRDSFQYSVTQALKQVAQEVAGVEALNYVTAWTELQADFSRHASNLIWLYEIGVGGIGVMRATHDLLRNQSDKLWQTLADRMTRCSTAQDEAFSRHLLAQPIEWLEQCDMWVHNVTTAGRSSERSTAIEYLLAQVRQQLGIPVRQAQLKTLLRVFIPDYMQEIDGLPLSNWRIFREINHEFLPQCARRLGRDPSFAEACALLYREIVQTRNAQQPPPYAEVLRLLQLYEDEYGAASTEVRKAFETGIERRMLLNCRCNCSSCLEDRSGEIEAPGMSRYLLNRPLMTEWVNRVRNHQTLEVEGEEDGSTVCDRLRSLLEEGCRTLYLRVRSDRLATLCATISYLSDAGIDTDFGMVYPMITSIHTVFANTLLPDRLPFVEITIRPIR